MAKVPAEVTRDREREAWQLRRQGWTQVRIADQIGVSQQAVDVMLSRIERKLAAEFKENAERVKAQQSAILEQIADEALTQWRRSCEDAVSETTVTGKTTGGKGGGKEAAADQSKAQRTRTVEGQTGNPALLEKAMAAMDRIREIWGLNAPKAEPPPPTPPGGTVGTLVIREVIVNLKRQENERDDPSAVVIELPVASGEYEERSETLGDR